MHSKGVLHRNLCPEAVRFAIIDPTREPTDAGSQASLLRLTDFAFAVATAAGDKEGDRVDWLALPDFLTVAPEIVRGDESVAYGKPADVWAVGVMLFLMLTGTAPFDLGEAGGGTSSSNSTKDKDKREGARLQAMLQGRPLRWKDESAERWSEVSEDARKLVEQLLSTDPSMRPSAAEALASPWFAAQDL